MTRKARPLVLLRAATDKRYTVIRRLSYATNRLSHSLGGTREIDNEPRPSRPRRRVEETDGREIASARFLETWN